MIRASVRSVRDEPSRSNSPSWSARSSLAWSARGRSPISSMKRVPPRASSKRPIRCAVAPVNAPFSWPNSSLSISVGGSAATFTLTSGRSARGLFAWIAWANSSLPVPVSPVRSTAVSVGATWPAKPERGAQRGAVADDVLEIVRAGDLRPEHRVLRLEQGRQLAHPDRRAGPHEGAGEHLADQAQARDHRVGEVDLAAERPDRDEAEGRPSTSSGKVRLDFIPDRAT